MLVTDRLVGTPVLVRIDPVTAPDPSGGARFAERAFGTGRPGSAAAAVA